MNSKVISWAWSKNGQILYIWPLDPQMLNIIVFNKYDFYWLSIKNKPVINVGDTINFGPIRATGIKDLFHMTFTIVK